MTIRKNIGTFRDGSSESMRRSVSTRRFADSVKSEVSGIDERVTSLETYTPDDPTQWADPPPTTIAEALDRLALLMGGTP